MAPKYLMRIIREPMPGKAFELIDAVIEQRQRMGITEGVTTASIAAPKMLIISSTPSESLSDLQSRVDGIFDDDEARAGWDRVGALAKSTVNNLSRVIEPPDGIENANYIQRYVFQHDTSSRRQLVAALQEMRAQGDGPKIGITQSTSGGAVVASRAVGSLAELEDHMDRLRDDPSTILRAASVLALCTSWSSGIAKVVSRP
ncbi:MAG: hypothetical protein ACE1ZA_03370 [Pseudomonadales bacterium]